MNKVEMITELNKCELVLKPYNETQWTIGSSRFANILLAFNPSIDVYSGGVTFKTINAPLFTGEQIKKAGNIVHEFLSTPVEERDLD